MFDYLSQELPSFEYTLGLFTLTGFSSGALANYLRYSKPLCKQHRTYNLDSKITLGKGLVMGIGMGFVAHYGANKGRQRYIDRTAYINSIKVHFIPDAIMQAFEDEVLERRARKAELLKMLAKSE